MAIRIICPSCGKSGRVSSAALGRVVRCPSCSHRIVTTAEIRSADSPSPAREVAAEPPEASPYPVDLEPIDLSIRPTPHAKVRTLPAVGSTGLMAMIAGGVIVLGVVLGLTIRANLAQTQVSADAKVRTIAASEVPPRESTTPGLNPPPPAPAPPEVPAPVKLASRDDAVEVETPTIAPEPPREDAEVEMTESDLVAGARAAASTLNARDQDAGAAKPLSTAEIVAESEPSVALIKGKTSTGTGFLVAPNLLATNAHVIADEMITDLEICFVSADDPRKGPLKAELLYEDPARDLAFLAVRTDLKPLRLAASYTFRKGEDVTVIGNPGMGEGKVLENAISRGIMSTRAQIDSQNFYQLGIAINPGNSGGPVFDSSGRVIGVATLKSAKQEAMGFGIPIEDLQSALARLGTQSSADANRARSRHRVVNLVKGLGSGGAILCLTIDLRRAATMTNDTDLRELLGKLEAAAADLDREVFPSLTSQSPRVGRDPLVAPGVKARVNRMTENFLGLRNTYAGRTNLGDDELRNRKQAHRSLITELSEELDLEFPEEMMTAFDDHSSPQQATIITTQPGGFGAFRPHVIPGYGMGPPMMPGMPMMPGRSSLMDRMRPRRGFP